MQILYKILIPKYPIWAISHAGHCIPPEDMEMMEGIVHYSVFKIKPPPFSSHFVTHNQINILHMFFLL